MAKDKAIFIFKNKSYEILYEGEGIQTKWWLLDQMNWLKENHEWKTIENRVLGGVIWGNFIEIIKK